MRCAGGLSGCRRSRINRLQIGAKRRVGFTRPRGKIVLCANAAEARPRRYGRQRRRPASTNLPAAGGVGQTKLGDLVYKGDVVQTGADGKVGITFTDGTAFNLSSNARMVLDEFVYDPNEFVGYGVQ
jgi:hypothetical protein